MDRLHAFLTCLGSRPPFAFKDCDINKKPAARLIWLRALQKLPAFRAFLARQGPRARSRTLTHATSAHARSAANSRLATRFHDGDIVQESEADCKCTLANGEKRRLNRGIRPFNRQEGLLAATEKDRNSPYFIPPSPAAVCLRVPDGAIRPPCSSVCRAFLAALSSRCYTRYCFQTQVPPI